MQWLYISECWSVLLMLLRRTCAEGCVWSRISVSEKGSCTSDSCARHFAPVFPLQRARPTEALSVCIYTC